LHACERCTPDGVIQMWPGILFNIAVASIARACVMGTLGRNTAPVENVPSFTHAPENPTL
jgi:hypothetical protein